LGDKRIKTYSWWLGFGRGQDRRQEIRPSNPKIYDILGLKMGPEIRVLGAPGRGVLQKMGQAYRRPVHFLAFFAIFTKNVQT